MAEQKNISPKEFSLRILQAAENPKSPIPLRDYFAAQAMIGVIAACANDARQGGEAFEEMFARKAYSIADAMLKARDQ